jgi:mono/diheme cytochrome c family protein
VRKARHNTREKALAALAAGAFLLCALPLGVGAHDRITTRVTWDREIEPLFNGRCVECHRPGGRSTIPLATYQQARPWAAAIKEEVLTRRMPKWSAARGYGDFANDPSLSPFEIALIAAWVDGGAPETEKNRPPTTKTAAMPKPATFTPPSGSSIRTTSMGCGNQAVSGRLLAIRPTLDKNASAGIAAALPNGRQEIIAWIRNFDPDYAPTYWLRKPLVLPRGSQLRIAAAGACAIEATFAR